MRLFVRLRSSVPSSNPRAFFKEGPGFEVGSVHVNYFDDYSFQLRLMTDHACTVCIGNSMVSSAIWKKHARVSFSKTMCLSGIYKK